MDAHRAPLVAHPEPPVPPNHAANASKASESWTAAAARWALPRALRPFGPKRGGGGASGPVRRDPSGSCRLVRPPFGRPVTPAGSGRALLQPIRSASPRAGRARPGGRRRRHAPASCRRSRDRRQQAPRALREPRPISLGGIPRARARLGDEDDAGEGRPIGRTRPAASRGPLGASSGNSGSIALLHGSSLTTVPSPCPEAQHRPATVLKCTLRRA